MIARDAIGVEFFFARGCSHCAKAREALREVSQSIAQVKWTEIDIGKNPQRAVDVGVVSTPAVAIDGKLVFSSLPSDSDLRSAIQASVRKD